jgi:hypothetical protein
MDSTWIDDLGGHKIETIAGELGLTQRQSRWGACPACDATRASRKDPRAPIRLTPGLGLWFCNACQLGGSVVDLISFAIAGRAMRGQGSAEPVRAWAASRGLLPQEPHEHRQVRQRPSARRSAVVPVVQGNFPPASEVAEVWRACRPVGEDADVVAALEARRIPVSVVEDRDLARALPEAWGLPPWCKGWRARHRLVLPLYGADGELKSLRGRAVNKDAVAKSLAPAGFTTRGLVFADSLARQILASGAVPHWLARPAELRIIIDEGGPAWLALCADLPERDVSTACMAIPGSGAWTAELASRIPTGCKVVIGTDDDPAGDKYAAMLNAQLGGRCEVRRWNKGGSLV